MSSANEDSRSGRSKPTSKQHQSAGSRDGTPGSQQNRRGGKQSQNVNKQDTLQNGPSSTPQPPREEPHVPIGGFNAGEVLAALKAGVGTKTPVYKPDANQSAGKGNPWGMKPGTMANGKDFWLDLRKQTSSLAASSGVRRGG